MAETEFLAAIAAYLQAASLAPVPKRIDVDEPVGAEQLPAVVLSLDSVQRLGSGLGERSALITNGSLPWSATIDLANPIVPAEHPGELVLPHGGLTAITKVTLNGNALTIVDHAPGAGEVEIDPNAGLLVFAALPATGTVVAEYVIAQWERRVTPIAGVLRVDVRGADAGDVSALSTAAVGALARAAHPNITGLRKIALSSLSSIGLADAQRANSRGRTALFQFDYEHEVNRPDSSGGVIRRIDIKAKLEQSEKGVEA